MAEGGPHGPREPPLAHGAALGRRRRPGQESARIRRGRHAVGHGPREEPLRPQQGDREGRRGAVEDRLRGEAGHRRAVRTDRPRAGEVHHGAQRALHAARRRRPDREPQQRAALGRAHAARVQGRVPVGVPGRAVAERLGLLRREGDLPADPEGQQRARSRVAPREHVDVRHRPHRRRGDERRAGDVRLVRAQRRARLRGLRLGRLRRRHRPHVRGHDLQQQPTVLRRPQEAAGHGRERRGPRVPVARLRRVEEPEPRTRLAQLRRCAGEQDPVLRGLQLQQRRAHQGVVVLRLHDAPRPGDAAHDGPDRAGAEEEAHQAARRIRQGVRGSAQAPRRATRQGVGGLLDRRLAGAEGHPEQHAADRRDQQGRRQVARGVQRSAQGPRPCARDVVRQLLVALQGARGIPEEEQGPARPRVDAHAVRRPRRQLRREPVRADGARRP